MGMLQRDFIGEFRYSTIFGNLKSKSNECIADMLIKSEDMFDSLSEYYMSIGNVSLGISILDYKKLIDEAAKRLVNFEKKYNI